MKIALFRAITQQVAVIPYRRLGMTYRSHLQGSGIQGKDFRPLIPLRNFPEKSVRNYHSSLPNSPEERSSLLIVIYFMRPLLPF